MELNVPDLTKNLDDTRLLAALAYYAERASRVNPNGTNRKMLRKLLRDYDLRVVELLREVEPWS